MARLALQGGHKGRERRQSQQQKAYKMVKCETQVQNAEESLGGRRGPKGQGGRRNVSLALKDG